MNPDIATLSRHPRGKPWRSRLISYAADIQRWRAEGVTYRQIALNLETRGLSISAAAVHDFVRVRDAQRSKGPYTLPTQAVPLEGPMQPLDASDRREDSHETTLARTNRQGTQRRKFVFLGQNTQQRQFTADDLQLNDPNS